MTTNATETAAQLTRAEKAALLGGAGGILAGVSHFSGNSTVTVVAIALLGIAAVMGFSSGWVWGLTPRPAATPESLVGMRIAFGGKAFTVIDDSAPSAAAAQRGGGRCSVMAVDGSGTVGLLFLELDRAGSVVAAATADIDWAAAGAVRV